MAKPKIIYFEVKGRAELVRLLLEDSGVEYENVFVSMQEWPKIKKDFPFGVLPAYSEGDRIIVESAAIYRYLARKYGLMPTQEAPLIRTEQIESATEAAMFELVMLFWSPEFAQKRDEMRTKVSNRLKHLEAFFAKEPGDYWLGDEVSYADYRAWNYLDVVRLFDNEVLQSYPLLTQFKKKMESRPRLNAYLRSERRPKCFTVSIATFGGQPDLWMPESI